MKSKFLAVSAALVSPAASQAFGPQEVITSLASVPLQVYAADLDGDGDADILSADESSGIASYENLGGGIFGAGQVISNGSSVSVYAEDLDGDGDLDVMGSSYGQDSVAWYENLGSAGFGPQQVIVTNVASRAFDVNASDLDGDGDADVIVALRDLTGSGLSGAAWCENLGGGTFGGPQLFDPMSSASSPISVKAADFDGDGDSDVLSGSSRGIEWLENLGSSTFGAPQVIYGGSNFTSSVVAADVDGDGDVDVLSSNSTLDEIAWYENLGGGAFGPKQVISNVADGAWSVYAADVDGDGDVDALSASLFDNKVAWYENLGAGSFGGEQLITTTARLARSVYAADLDGDGDADVLSASDLDSKIAWYENWSNACVFNSSFETGDLQGWNLVDNPVPYFPGQVLSAGAVNPPSLPFDCEPTAGDQAFAIGFDGVPATYSLSQTIFVTDRSTLLTFNYRASWFFADPSASMDRTFDVVVRDVFFGTRLQETRWLTAEAGSSGDLDSQVGQIDLRAFEGQFVTVSFEWIVPEEFTGPGIFQLDNIRCASLIGPRVGENYCVTAVNSSGQPAAMAASGSATATHNNLTIAATSLPPNQFGIFFTSMTQGFNPGASGTSNGILCVDGTIGRYSQVLNSGSNGAFTLPIDLLVIPQGGTIIGATAGQTWNFQAWFRDNVGLSSNFTDGVSVLMN